MAEHENKINNILHEVAKNEELQDYEIKLKPISSGGANYTSILYVATITSKNKEDLNLFIKVAVIGEQLRSLKQFKLYEVENFIYTELQTKFRNIEDKHGVSGVDRLAIPKFYAASTVPREEMIVLENLVARGFKSHDRMKSVDWEYAASAIRELAKLHALSIALQHENPEEYQKLLDYFKYEDFEEFDGMDAFFENSKKNALEVIRKENFDRLNKFFKNSTFIEFWTRFNAVRCEVLAHGDFRPSNMLHRTRHDGTVEVIPVDYQTLRGGSPVADLLYFIFTGTDKQFRDQHYDRLVEHYYSELSAALSRLGVIADEEYSRQEFYDELKEKLPFGLGVAVFTLPIVTVEAENAPKVDENFDLADFSIETTGSLYPERLNGVVDDFVIWGVI